MPSNKKNFVTARTRKFWQGALRPEDERTIGNIEEFGCSVVSVKRTQFGLGWSYTIGMFDTCGKPEIIAVGLLPETAHFALDEAAKLSREGVDLSTPEPMSPAVRTRGAVSISVIKLEVMAQT